MVLWQRLRDGLPAAVIGRLPEAPADVQPVHVHCSVALAEHEPLGEARRLILALLGEVEEKRKVVRRGRKAAAEPEVDEALAELWDRLARQPGPTRVVVMDHVEAADPAVLATLVRVVGRAEGQKLPLVLVFAGEPGEAAEELLAAVRGRGGDAVFRREVMAAALLRKLPVDVVQVLRAGGRFGAEFAAGDVARLLGCPVLEVLERLQSAVDLGVAVEDLGGLRFALAEELVAGLSLSLLPSLAQAWDERFAWLTAGPAVEEVAEVPEVLKVVEVVATEVVEAEEPAVLPVVEVGATEVAAVVEPAPTEVAAVVEPAPEEEPVGVEVAEETGVGGEVESLGAEPAVAAEAPADASLPAPSVPDAPEFDAVVPVSGAAVDVPDGATEVVEGAADGVHDARVEGESAREALVEGSAGASAAPEEMSAALAEESVEAGAEPAEASVEAGAEPAEVSVEAGAEPAEVSVEASAVEEASVEAGAEPAEVSVEASAEPAEASVEAGAEREEASVEASAVAEESVEASAVAEESVEASAEPEASVEASVVSTGPEAKVEESVAAKIEVSEGPAANEETASSGESEASSGAAGGEVNDALKVTGGESGGEAGATSDAVAAGDADSAEEVSEETGLQEELLEEVEEIEEVQEEASWQSGEMFVRGRRRPGSGASPPRLRPKPPRLEALKAQVVKGEARMPTRNPALEVAALMKQVPQPMDVPLGGEVRAAEEARKSGDLLAAAEYYRRAGHEAAEMGAPKIAVQHIQQALTLLQGLPRTPERRRIRGGALLELGQLQWQATAPELGFSLAQALTTLETAAMELGTTAPTPVAVQLCQAIAGVCFERGDAKSLVRALQELASANKMLMADGDEAGAARLLNDQAAVLVRMGDPVQALHLLKESRKVFQARSEGDVVALRELAETDHLFARLPLHAEMRAGRELEGYRAGLAHAQKAERAYRQLGDARELGRLWETMGRLELRMEQLETATKHLESAVDVQMQLGDLTGLARTTEALSEVLGLRGRDGEAINLLRESIQFNRNKGSPLGLSINRQVFTAMAVRLGAHPMHAPALHEVEVLLAAGERELGTVEGVGE